MYIRLTSIFVKDQEQALQFYTGILGFKVKNDIPMGEHRWLTVVSPHEPDGTELVLEPMAFEPARVYQAKLFEAGIPATAFLVDDVDLVHQELLKKKVDFSMPPTTMGPTRITVLDDTCGNHIQLFQML